MAWTWLLVLMASWPALAEVRRARVVSVAHRTVPATVTAVGLVVTARPPVQEAAALDSPVAAAPVGLAVAAGAPSSAMASAVLAMVTVRQIMVYLQLDRVLIRAHRIFRSKTAKPDEGFLMGFGRRVPAGRMTLRPWGSGT